MIMHVVSIVARLSGMLIVDRQLIAVDHTVIALLKLLMRPRHVCLCGDVIVTVSSIGLATILK